VGQAGTGAHNKRVRRRTSRTSWRSHSRKAALQPISEFGRVYAAYGGIFIALSLTWGIMVEGFEPDRWDLLGALICVVGVVVMVAPPRG
jgi:drug/metabolite transporter superfamily protein YnfA